MMSYMETYDFINHTKIQLIIQGLESGVREIAQWLEMPAWSLLDGEKTLPISREALPHLRLQAQRSVCDF